MKEIMKERLESLVEERSEHAELNHTLENVLNLQDGLAYVKQYGKHPQNEKLSISLTIKNTYYINLKNRKNLLTL